MKKSALPALLLLFGVGLSGCPVYGSDDVGCFSDLDCANGYVCDDGSGTCVVPTSNASPSCNRPHDCGKNETCGRSGTCVAGDCHFASVGCVNGYVCSSSTSRWECLAEGPGGNGGAASGGTPSTSGGDAAVTDGGSPAAAGAGG